MSQTCRVLVVAEELDVALRLALGIEYAATRVRVGAIASTHADALTALRDARPDRVLVDSVEGGEVAALAAAIHAHDARLLIVYTSAEPAADQIPSLMTELIEGRRDASEPPARPVWTVGAPSVALAGVG